MARGAGGRGPSLVRATLIVAVAAAGAIAAPAGAVVGNHAGHGHGPADVDARTGRLAPTVRQLAAVRELGVKRVRWNRFGTPRALRKARGGALATGLSSNAVRASRQFLRANRAVFRLSRADVGRLELVNDSEVGRSGHVVLLRQRFGDLRPTLDGLVSLAVKKGRVLYVTSTLTPLDAAPAPATLSAGEAFVALATSLGHDVKLSALKDVRTEKGWTVFGISRVQELQRARLTAFATYTEGVRAAFEVWYVDPFSTSRGTEAFKAFVDARSGQVLFRKDMVLNAVGCGPDDDPPASNADDFQPDWCTFPANPPLGPDPLSYPSGEAADNRQVWCWTFSAGCQRTLDNETPRAEEFCGEWDVIPTVVPLGICFGVVPGMTTTGNNADTRRQWFTPLSPGPDNYQPVSPNRDYRFAFTDAWHKSQCSPSNFVDPLGGNDSDAAAVNLFVQHNRHHDFAYFLGYTEQNYNQQFSNFGRGASTGSPETREGDPQIGDVQAGAVTGGYPTFLGRDNANQIPTPDGVPPISNMYLWQPIKSGFYPPCVDGDYDASVIGHEYTHATSNRMVAGPDAGLDLGHQAGAMGESWSDLVATEYLQEFGLVPVSGENPWAVGPYATGSPQRGIRNYPLNDNPLNYSDIGYDTAGESVHANGEIWNGTNFDLRQALVARYGNGTREIQAQCAAGRRQPQVCPGNRRWIQIVFDAWLLMQNNVDMLDARDAYLAADQLRFAGANQDILWNAFAKRGFGVNAQSISGDDEDPLPNFESPYARNATLRFVPTSKGGGARPKDVEFFVGDYEGEVSPIADTKPTEANDPQPRSDRARFVPGTYRFVARAPGFGLVRFTRTLSPGQSTSVTVAMPRNLASTHNGATATGDAGCTAPSSDPFASCADAPDVLRNLIDDTEETSWRSDGKEADQVRVFIDLAGTTPQRIRQVKASAFPNPVDETEDPTSDPDIPRGRFTTLRQFEVKVCTRTQAVDCTQDAQYASVLTSPPDSFPGGPPRPVSPNLILRAFPIPGTVTATHVQFHVLKNQCTGVELFQTDYDNDPFNNPDCRTQDPNPAALDGGKTSNRVTAAEFQVNAVTG